MADEQTTPWYSTMDDETKGYLTTRGWDKKTPAEAAAEAIKAHRNAESKLGIPADRVLRLPDESDKDGWKAVWARMGVPSDPAAYDFTGVQADDRFLATMRQAAADLNLSKDAARGVAERIVKYEADKKTESEKTLQVSLALAQQQLDASWGANKDTFKFIADRAASLLGISPEALGEMAKATSYPQVMEGLRRIGVAMGEGKLLGVNEAGGGNNRALTREEALARKADLFNDRDWGARWMKGEKTCVDELSNLDRIIVGAPRL